MKVTLDDDDDDDGDTSAIYEVSSESVKGLKKYI
jgi:hypothetical protein